MAKTRRRRKSRTERGEELQAAGKAEHLGGGRYRIRSLRGDKVNRALWRQGKVERACTCSDPCMDEYGGFWDHCEHVCATIADRDAALKAAATVEEKAETLQNRGDVHIRDGSDRSNFALCGSEPHVHVEDLGQRYTLPLDLSDCRFWDWRIQGSATCPEFIETGGECAHVLAARMERKALEEAA